MPVLEEGKEATARRDQCVKGLEGKTNKRTGKPYTMSERFAICTAAITKAKHSVDEDFDDLFLAQVAEQVLSSVEAKKDSPQESGKNVSASCESVSTDKSLSNKDIIPVKNAKVSMATDRAKTDADGSQKVAGRTDEARSSGFLHDHSFSLLANLDEAGALTFKGKTDEWTSPKGQPHTHPITAIAARNDQTEYEIETDRGSDDSDGHLIHVEMKEPMEEPEGESASADAESDDELGLAAPAVHTESRLKESEQHFGLVVFADGFDGRRDYKGTTFAFCSSLASEKSTTGISKIKLEPDGRLKQMVFRTGTFIHPFYGLIVSDDQKVEELKKNFDNNVFGQMAVVNVHHQHHLGALGVHRDLTIEPDEFISRTPTGKKIVHQGSGLYSHIEFTPFGQREVIDDRKYFYASSEIIYRMKSVERHSKKDMASIEVYGNEAVEDPEIESDDDGYRLIKQNLFVGSAMTNTPFIPGLRPIMASTNQILEIYNDYLKRFGDPIKLYVALLQELEKRGIY